MAVDLQTFYVNETEVAMALEDVQWTQETISELQENINKTNILNLCIADIFVSHWQYICVNILLVLQPLHSQKWYMHVVLYVYNFSHISINYINVHAGCCRYSQ